MTMTATPTQESIRQEVLAEIDRQLGVRTAAAAVHGDEFVRLWSLAGATVRGGKLIRPLLMVQTACALGVAADRTSIVTSLAAAIELLHYSFVLHDDVIDGDFVRRHNPNLQGALRDDHPAPCSDSAAHWARSGGILMGDLLLSGVHQTFARLDVDAAVRERLLNLLDVTITETVAGEHLDVGLSDGAIEPDLRTTLLMTSRKTAAYTFELPLRAAAILAGANVDIEAALTVAGRHLGHAFQLQDDLLGAFGDPGEHGKDVLTDFRSGKQTAIIAHARQTDQWPQIQRLLARCDTDPLARGALLRVLEECGARRFAEDLVQAEVASLRDMLNDDSSLPPAVCDVLSQQLRQLEGRRA